MYRKSAVPHWICFMSECHDQLSWPWCVWEHLCCHCYNKKCKERDKSSHFITMSHPWSENIAILENICELNHDCFIKTNIYIRYIMIINIKIQSRFVFILCRSVREQGVWCLCESMKPVMDVVLLLQYRVFGGNKISIKGHTLISFLFHFYRYFFPFTSNDYQTHYDFPFFNVVFWNMVNTSSKIFYFYIYCFIFRFFFLLGF